MCFFICKDRECLSFLYFVQEFYFLQVIMEDAVYVLKYGMFFLEALVLCENYYLRNHLIEIRSNISNQRSWPSNFWLL